MSVNNPGIAAQATQRLAVTYGAKVRVIPVAPGETYSTVENGVLTQKTTTPVAHGELIIQEIRQDDFIVMVLYVAVDIGDVLYWKKANIVPGVDRYTRRPVGSTLS